jgi:two-component system OmpR family response regulator
LTAADSVEERVKGLDYGADDYSRFIAGVGGAARPGAAFGAWAEPAAPSNGPLVYDQAGRVAHRRQMLELSARELGLLECCYNAPGGWSARTSWLSGCANGAKSQQQRDIEVCIHRLRKRSKGPIRIAVRGLGYCLEKYQQA